MEWQLVLLVALGIAALTPILQIRRCAKQASLLTTAFVGIVKRDTNVQIRTLKARALLVFTVWADELHVSSAQQVINVRTKANHPFCAQKARTKRTRVKPSAPRVHQLSTAPRVLLRKRAAPREELAIIKLGPCVQRENIAILETAIAKTARLAIFAMWEAPI